MRIPARRDVVAWIVAGLLLGALVVVVLAVDGVDQTCTTVGDTVRCVMR